jgi:hypothetical protein
MGSSQFGVVKYQIFYRQKFTNKLYPKGSEIILIQMNILLIKIKNQIET